MFDVCTRIQLKALHIVLKFITSISKALDEVSKNFPAENPNFCYRCYLIYNKVMAQYSYPKLKIS